MLELEKTPEVQRLIQITRSDSGVSGPELARAHMELGSLLAGRINCNPADTTVVAILRGGLFFAEGLYFGLGCRFQTYDPKHEEFQRPDTGTVILADAVINTGSTIRKILQPDMSIACCVIQERAAGDFGDQLYTVRVSSNSFVGSHVRKQAGTVGPDTTLRLFNIL